VLKVESQNVRFESGQFQDLRRHEPLTESFAFETAHPGREQPAPRRRLLPLDVLGVNVQSVHFFDGRLAGHHAI
jgi:hypothetical protein